jgi:hypothetical protein
MISQGANRGQSSNVTEEQLQQMFYSSVGGITVNQTAQFTNNFNTIDAAPITSQFNAGHVTQSDQNVK